MMVELIRAEEVEVIIHGENWNEANAEAEKFLATHSDAYFVHPYDQETTWIGHSSIVHEIKDQMKECFEVDEAPESIDKYMLNNAKAEACDPAMDAFKKWTIFNFVQEVL